MRFLGFRRILSELAVVRTTVVHLLQINSPSRRMRDFLDASLICARRRFCLAMIPSPVKVVFTDTARFIDVLSIRVVGCPMLSIEMEVSDEVGENDGEGNDDYVVDAIREYLGGSSCRKIPTYVGSNWFAPPLSYMLC